MILVNSQTSLNLVKADSKQTNKQTNKKLTLSGCPTSSSSPPDKTCRQILFDCNR